MLLLSRIFIITSLIVFVIIAVWPFFGIHNNTELVDKESLIMRTPVKHRAKTYNLTDTIVSPQRGVEFLVDHTV